MSNITPGIYALDPDHLKKWYDGGCRLFYGWASTKNTSGAFPDKDRAAQLEWRAAVKALGPDARYVDYPLPRWTDTTAPADVAAMLNDPQCLGFMGPDEPNLSPPTDTTGKVWRVTRVQWELYWSPILTADPFNSKRRVCDFAGNKLSAAWGSYTGEDAIPYASRLTDLCTNWHPRNTYGDDPGHADCDVYPSRAVRMLGRISANKPRWYISECAAEQLGSSPNGRAPTEAELIAQVQKVQAEDFPTNPLKYWIWFPQRPRPGAAHIFDNTTPAQFATVVKINAMLNPQPVPAPTPAPGPTPDQRLTLLESQVSAQATTIAGQGDAINAQSGLIQDLRGRLAKAAQAFAPPP